jgi:hypothetical protein
MATTRSKFAHAKVLVAALAVGMGLAAAPPAEAVPAKTAVVFDVKFANGTYVPAGVNVRLDRPWGIIAWGKTGPGGGGTFYNQQAGWTYIVSVYDTTRCEVRSVRLGSRPGAPTEGRPRP